MIDNTHYVVLAFSREYDFKVLVHEYQTYLGNSPTVYICLYYDIMSTFLIERKIAYCYKNKLYFCFLVFYIIIYKLQLCPVS